MELIKNKKIFIYSIVGAVILFLIIAFSGKKEIKAQNKDNSNKINKSNKDVSRKNKELKEKLNGKSITGKRKKPDNSRPEPTDKEEGKTVKDEPANEPTIGEGKSAEPVVQ